MIIDKVQLAASFNHVAEEYEKHAVLQKLVAERLLDRLHLMKLSPHNIVEAGCGTGLSSKQLSQLFPSARVYQLDIAWKMLLQAKRKSRRFFSKCSSICCDVEQLPLRGNSLDMIFSSLMLQWCSDLDQTLKNFRNALQNQGLLVFATLGPDTLKELRASWTAVDDNVHINTFLDMHDVGDALIRAGFVEPVMNVEHMSMKYSNALTMMKELQRLGVRNVNKERVRGLTGRQKLARVLDAYEKFRTGQHLPATYEVIYGHAWVPLQQTTATDSMHQAVFPISSLRLRKR